MDTAEDEWGLVAPSERSVDQPSAPLGPSTLRNKVPDFLAHIDPSTVPRATHAGKVRLGDKALPCAVLDNNQRVLTQQGFLGAIGRSRAAKGGQGATVESLPAFMAAKNLRPFVSEKVERLSRPVIYKPTEGGYHGIAFGYTCELLPAVCQVYVDAYHADALRPKQIPIYTQCDILLRGLQVVGIASLIDEATGFQADRTRDAMQAILREFISEELVAWTKTFPDEFYEELFRLRGIHRVEFNSKRPRYFAHLTRDIVYARLAPNVLEALEKLTPIDSNGRRTDKLFQRLTQEVGYQKLKEHLSNVITLMKASPNEKVFMRLLNRAKPRFTDVLSGQTILQLGDDDDL